MYVQLSDSSCMRRAAATDIGGAFMAWNYIVYCCVLGAGAMQDDDPRLQVS